MKAAENKVQAEKEAHAKADAEKKKHDAVKKADKVAKKAEHFAKAKPAEKKAIKEAE